jgi:hypothetical protein
MYEMIFSVTDMTTGYVVGAHMCFDGVKAWALYVAGTCTYAIGTPYSDFIPVRNQ